MRVFIAVTLPAAVRQRIGALVKGLKVSEDAVKWVEENNFHLTLKFLGEVVDSQLAEVIRSVETKLGGAGSFKIELEGTGTFPPGKPPRVVWVGVGSGRDKLANLARSLNAGEFVAHVAIGRIKENKKGVDSLQEKLGSLPAPQLGEATVDSVKIMKSTLTPQGPVYEIIKEVKL